MCNDQLAVVALELVTLATGGGGTGGGEVVMLEITLHGDEDVDT